MARGINIEKLSQLQREAIDSSIHRAIAQAKHAPVHSTPMHARATAPGETLICAGFGLHHAPSPVDGAVYQFHAIDEYSSFGYTSTCKTHTTEDWIHFLRQVKLDAEKHGHKIVTVRFDRAPELRRDELKRLVAEQLGILVDLSPREHHEAVGRAERNNNVLTREAERMLQLAGLGTQLLLPARTYAQWLRNRLAVAGMPESRYQRYLRQVPDLSAMIPYTFGTTVAIVEDVRGPKGSLDHPCGFTGRFIGISGSSYLVYRDRRATVVHQSHVRPLNGLALVRGSLPASVATVDTGTTMGTVPFELDGPAAPPTASPSKAPLPTVDVPIGTRIDVRWKSRGGREADAWWLDEVIAVRDYENGRRRHRVAYEGFDEDQWYWHDLASDDFEWRPAVAAPTPDAAPARPPQGRYPLRNRAQASAAEFIECALESCQASNVLESFNAAVSSRRSATRAPPSSARTPRTFPPHSTRRSSSMPRLHAPSAISPPPRVPSAISPPPSAPLRQRVTRRRNARLTSSSSSARVSSTCRPTHAKSRRPSSATSGSTPTAKASTFSSPLQETAYPCPARPGHPDRPLRHATQNQDRPAHAPSRRAQGLQQSPLPRRRPSFWHATPGRSILRRRDRLHRGRRRPNQVSDRRRRRPPPSAAQGRCAQRILARQAARPPSCLHVAAGHSRR